MTVRRILPQERIAATKIQSIAFLFKRDFSTAETNPEEFQKNYETTIGYFNEEGKMCSCFSLLPYEVRFNNHTVKMGGIGGVASLPEERNKGNIREIFRYAFEEMYKDNQIFSYLYPFSHPYYRKYGYEHAYRRVVTTIPMESFKSFPRHGNVRHYHPGESQEDIKKIYDKFIKDKSLSVVRNEKLWNDLIEKDPYTTLQYTYIWYDDSGEPMSYVIFQPEGTSEVNMKVKELIWLDYASLEGLLGFLHRFYPRYKNFIYAFPEYVNLHVILPEPYEIKGQMEVFGMNRIVNLEKVLSIMDYPGEQGQLAINVKDSFLEWNSGTFVITWGPQGIKVAKKECPADLECSIEVMSQLVTGYTEIGDYMCRSDVKVYGQYELLSSLFKKKHCFINDYF